MRLCCFEILTLVYLLSISALEMPSKIAESKGYSVFLFATLHKIFSQKYLYCHILVPYEIVVHE